MGGPIISQSELLAMAPQLSLECSLLDIYGLSPGALKRAITRFQRTTSPYFDNLSSEPSFTEEGVARIVRNATQVSLFTEPAVGLSTISPHDRILLDLMKYGDSPDLPSIASGIDPVLATKVGLHRIISALGAFLRPDFSPEDYISMLNCLGMGVSGDGIELSAGFKWYPTLEEREDGRYSVQVGIRGRLASGVTYDLLTERSQRIYDRDALLEHRAMELTLRSGSGGNNDISVELDAFFAIREYFNFVLGEKQDLTVPTTNILYDAITMVLHDIHGKVPGLFNLVFYKPISPKAEFSPQLYSDGPLRFDSTLV